MNKINYEQYSILYLRNYAKQIGVKSPTSLSKAELIKKIENVESGIDEPYFSNKGRPNLLTNESVRKNSLTKKQEKEIKKLIYDFVKK